MSDVRIIAPKGDPGRVCNAHGTRVFVDGSEIQDLRDITMKFPVDGAVTMDLEIYVGPNFVYEGPASVNLHLHLPEGSRAVDVTNQDTNGAKFMIIKVEQEIPSVLCEHANECPSVCPCPANCSCRRIGSAPSCKE